MQIYGIDLSMKKFDVSYLNDKGKPELKVVKNKVIPIERFLKSLTKDVVLCAEHTGVYGSLLVYLCNQKSIKISLISGYTIKHSLGLTKGKSDELDAQRIQEYGIRFNDKLIFKNYDRPEISELKELHTVRAHLVRIRKGLLTSEKGTQNLPFQSISAHNHSQQVIDKLTHEIGTIDKEIDTIIKSDKSISNNFQLVIQIKGIGPVIATDLIIKTGNFINIDTARKAASYAGVCPFPNASGKMAGKYRTSHLADKKLKSLLYLGAKSAAKHNPAYRLYFERKKLEGKPYYLIMNNIANKMLRTAYSIVKNGQTYNIYHNMNDPRNITSSEKKVA